MCTSFLTANWRSLKSWKGHFMGPNEVMTSAAAADFFLVQRLLQPVMENAPEKENEFPLKYGYFVYQR